MTISLPGSLSRLRALIASHRSSVEALLRRSGVPEGDAPDGAQRVFLVAARRLDDVPPEKERAFLLGVARRVALDARRSARRRPDAAVELPVDIADVAPLADERLDHARARRLVDRALASMQDDLREVFVLARIEEHTLSEIAERIGIPRGTAASRLRRANERFDEVIARDRARDDHGRAVARRAALFALFPRWTLMRAALALSTSALVAAPSVSTAPPPPVPIERSMFAAPHPGSPTATGGGRRTTGEVVEESVKVARSGPRASIPALPRLRAESRGGGRPAAETPRDVPLPPPASRGEDRGGEAGEADTLLAELRSLEAVRAAAARGDTARARALLDAHRSAYPAGDLGPEASLLGADVAASRSGGRPAHAR